MIRYDVLYNEDGLRVENNDLVYLQSDEQHIEDTINAGPGWYKENFTDGVDIRKFLNSDGQEQVLARKIKLELSSDLYRNCSPIINFTPAGVLNINPNVVL
jgi:hypothetical protein